MTWKVLAWIEEEARELLAKGLELVSEDIVDRASTPESFVKWLPIREWGFKHMPAIPYWADAHGDPDLKHILATLAKLDDRGEEGIPTAYHGLGTAFTIDEQTHNAYAFLYGGPRPGTGDDPPKGTPAPTLLALDDARDFTLSWTTHQNVYKESQDLVGPLTDTLTMDDAATEAFWPTIAGFGIPYNLLVLAKVGPDRAAELKGELGEAWATEEMSALHADGLLYEIDMRIIGRVKPTVALDKSVRYAPGTVTLLKQDRRTKALTPIAITVWSADHRQRHTYLRSHNAWRYALQAAKASITVWGIWIGHVGHWHIGTASMQMTMYNHLPHGHQLYELMQPQSQSLIDFNFVLMTHLWGQISPPTPVNGYMQLLDLLNEFSKDRTSFFDDDPLDELRAHGISADDFTVNVQWDAYPIAGFLLDLWKITGDYVTAVVHDMYQRDDDVANDTSLQNWMAAANDPEQGNIRGLPVPIESRADLAKVLTSMLYRVTAHGAGSLNPVVNPVLSFVATFPPCLQGTDLPDPDDVQTTGDLLAVLPHTGTIGLMATFYFTFAYSTPYERLIPSDGFEADGYFKKESCNEALFAYRKSIDAFVTEYLIAWNEAVERIRKAPGSVAHYAEHQAGQWPRSIEI